MQKIDINNAIKKLKANLIDTFGKQIEIHLFGSVARNNYDIYSDIDILVLFPGKVNNTIEEQIFNLAYDVELEYNVVLGIVVYSKEFWSSNLAKSTPFYKNVKKEGILI